MLQTREVALRIVAGKGVSHRSRLLWRIPHSVRLSVSGVSVGWEKTLEAGGQIALVVAVAVAVLAVAGIGSGCRQWQWSL